MIYMSCEEIQSKLSRYLDEQLDGNELQEVEKHLESCAGCRAFLQKLKKLEAIADDFKISAGDEYWQGRKEAVMDEIARAESEKIIPITPKQRRYTWYRFAAVAASVALVAVISIFESRDLETTQALFKKEKADYIDFNRAPVEDAGDRGRRADSLPGKGDVRLATRPQIPPDTAARELMEKAAYPETKIGIPKPVAAEEEIAGETVIKTVDEFAVPTVTRKGSKEAPSRIDEDQEGYRAQEKSHTEKAPSGEEDRVAGLPDFQSDINIPAPSSPESINVLEDAMEHALFLKAPEPDDEIMDAFDVAMPTTGLSRVDIDPLAFADFSEDEIQLYLIYRQKVENLNDLYGDFLSPHYEETAAKSRLQLSEDSVSLIAMDMADAYHDLGMLTPIESERKSLLSWLKKLLRLVKGDDYQERVEDYISDLERPGE